MIHTNRSLKSHTNVDSPTCSIITKAITKIENKRWRDSGKILIVIGRCARHVSDIVHVHKRISKTQVVKKRNKDVDDTCFECSNDISISVKDCCYRSNVNVSSNAANVIIKSVDVRKLHSTSQRRKI